MKNLIDDRQVRLAKEAVEAYKKLDAKDRLLAENSFRVAILIVKRKIHMEYQRVVEKFVLGGVNPEDLVKLLLDLVLLPKNIEETIASIGFTDAARIIEETNNDSNERTKRALEYLAKNPD